MEQGKGAIAFFPTEDVTDVGGPRQREVPGPWSRRARTVSLPSPAPNQRVQATAGGGRDAPGRSTRGRQQRG